MDNIRHRIVSQTLSSQLENVKDEEKEKKKTSKQGLVAEWTKSWTFWFVLLTSICFFTRFYNLSWPQEVLFDEVYFYAFPRFYISREYFFDIHPPLAKLLLAGLGYICGWDTAGSLEFWRPRSISRNYRGDIYFYFRLWQGTWGSMLCPLAFLTLRELGASLPGCIIGASFIILELGLQTISRAILTDSLLYFFIALSLFLSLRLFREEQKCKGKSIEGVTRIWWVLSIFTGISLGSGLCVKWTALNFVGLVSLRLFFRGVRDWFKIGRTGLPGYISQNDIFTLMKRILFSRRMIGGIIVATFIIIAYLVPWFFHFGLLTQTGIDEDSMNLNFRAQLNRSTIYLEPGEEPQGTLTSIIYLHKSMFAINSASKFVHAYGSPWYEWPILRTSVLYWIRHQNGLIRQIKLIGNPPLYAFAVLGVLAALLMCAHMSYSEDVLLPSQKRFYLSAGFLLVGYFGNLIPYLWITRTTFMYHYHPSLYCGLLLVALVADYSSSFPPEKKSLLRRILRSLLFFGLIGIGLAGYLYFMPFSFGTPLTPDEANARNWSSRW